ncbi:HugZ family protein [Thiolapillus sp.]|uniref:HugZ family pyridoxamine 5'-phosphate oxidase n=2 Tax=Thiolapillus sp. TaxID=2017437 RepID=UPI0025EE7945|nr:pyridoxamine 5'-phosphate oxidase family protein [Thiolapillus sp.]
MPDQDPKVLQQQVQDFRAGFQSVLIATTSLEGEPDISYAPFVLDDSGRVCIYISQLARHTRNLLEQPRASLMFIAGEQDSRNLFARQRLILQCTARRVPEAEAEPVLQQMQARFGKTLELLRSLPDFLLFRLDVENGSFIKGFGQGWSLEGNGLQILALRTN